MNRTLVVAAAAVLLASAAHAQSYINTTPSRNSNVSSGFTIGPRVSSYSTDVDTGLFTTKTGRQTGFGLAGDFRSGLFAMNFMYDHDPENGLSVAKLVGIDTGNYSRDRGEVMFGLAALPGLDISAGIRSETLRIGGAAIFGNSVFSDLDFDHQALAFGARLHTTTDRPFGLYADGRAYVGTAKFKDVVGNASTDTTGYRGEAGLSVPLGESKWSVAPAIEYEHIEAKDFGIRLDTNRLMVNFLYHSAW